MKLPDFLSDVQIRTAPIPPELAGAAARGVLWQAAPGRFLLEAPEVARYLVEDGRRIIIAPVEQDAILSHEGEIAQFLNLTPLAALLYQRGMLAFHASAIAPPSPPESGGEGGRGVEGGLGAIILAGDSGAGKSTLLAALIQRGWTPLADDLAAVGLDENGQPVVYPTLQEIRLWPDTIEKLKISNTDKHGYKNKSASIRVHPRPMNQSASTPQPLRAIYWLSVHNRDDIEHIPFQGAERFEILGKLTYNTHIADALLDRAAYFRLAAAITQSVPLRRLRRPRGRWSVEELVEKIEREW